MQKLTTRGCTEVYFGTPAADAKVTFESRSTTSEINGRPGIFHSTPIEKNEVSDILQRLLEGVKKPSKRIVIKKESTRVSFEEKVNCKRTFIAQVLRNNPTWSMAEVMRFTKSGFTTVKRVFRDLQYCQAPAHFHYNNIKTPEELSQLQNTLENAHEEFKTVNDIKRVHKQFSRKEIAKQMKKLHIR